MISSTIVPALKPSPDDFTGTVDVVVGICTGPAGSRSVSVVVVRGSVTTGPCCSVVVVVDCSVVVVSSSEVDVSGVDVLVDGRIVNDDWLATCDVEVDVEVVGATCADAGRRAATDTIRSAAPTTIQGPRPRTSAR